MEFNDVYKELVEEMDSKEQSVETFDDCLLSAFEKQCDSISDFIQLEELRCLLTTYKFSNIIFPSSFGLLGDTFRDINGSILGAQYACEMYEEKGIPCHIYSYYLNGILSNLHSLRPELDNLKLDKVHWIHPRDYDYESKIPANITGSRSFSRGCLKISKNDFDIIGGVLTKYRGKSAIVSIPNDVSEIEAGAFEGNDKVMMIYMPNSVAYIEPRAFAGCTKLKSIFISDNIDGLQEELFDGCIELQKVYAKNVDKIAPHCFKDCFALNCNFPKVHVVYDGGFMGCRHFNAEKMIPNLDFIGKNAFAGCIIKSATFKDGVKLRNNIFGPNTDIKEISFTGFADKEFIKDKPFEKCTSLNKINFEKGTNIRLHTLFVENDEVKLFNEKFPNDFEILTGLLFNREFKDYTNIKEITANYVDIIPESCFENLTSVSKISFNDEIKTIGKNAFKNCKNLSELNLEFSGSELSEYAFAGCNSLNASKIVDKVTKFGAHSLEGVNLTNFNFDRKYQLVGDYAFADIKTDTNINFEIKGFKVGRCIFKGVEKIDTLIINDLKDIPNNSIQNLFGEVSVGLGITEINKIIVEGNLYKDSFKNIKNVNEIICSCSDGIIPEGAFKYASDIGKITIRNKIEEIKNDAFSRCTNVKSFSMVHDDLKVGFHAFFGASDIAKKINLSKVTSFGDQSFAFTDVENVNISDKTVRLGRGVFGNCYKLKKVSLPFIGETINSNDDTCYLGYIFDSVLDTNNEDLLDEQIYDNDKKYLIPKALEEVEIRSEFINKEALNYLRCIEKISLPNIKKLEKGMMKYCDNLETLEINGNVENYDGSILGDAKVDNIIFTKSNDNYLIEDGVIYSKDGKTLYFCPKTAQLSTIISKVEKIDTNAVARDLADIRILNDVKIEQNAFRIKNINSFYIENDMNISKNSFVDVKNINYVNLINCNVDSIVDATDKLNFYEVNITGCDLSNLESLISKNDKIKAKYGYITSCKLDEKSLDSFYEFESLTIKNCGEKLPNNLLKDIKIDTLEIDYLPNKLSDIFGQNYLEINTLIICQPTTIKTKAFEHFKIKNLIMNECLNIEDDAFSDSEIENISFKKVDDISINAFGNSNVKNFEIQNPNDKIQYAHGLLIKDNKIVKAINYKYDSIKIERTVGAGAFKDCKILKELNIIGKDIEIAKNAFEGCTNIKTLYINGYDKYLGDIISSFNIEDAEFENIDIPEALFSKCKTLKTVKITNAKEIGMNAFDECTNLEKVNYFGDNPTPLRVDKIGQSAFYKTGIKKLIIDAKVVDSIALAGQDYEYLEFSNRLEEIADDALYFCKVDELVSDSNTIIVDDHQFIDTENNILLKVDSGYSKPELVLDDLKITTSAFLDNKAIESVIFDNCEVSKSAFFRCPGLRKIVSTNTKFDKEVFYMCPIDDIEIDEINVNGRHDIQALFAAGNIGDSNKKIKFTKAIHEGNFGTEIDKFSKISFPNVKEFPNKYFKGGRPLASLNLPSNLTWIGDETFEGVLDFETLELNNNITHIGLNAFAKNPKIVNYYGPFGGINADFDTNLSLLFGKNNSLKVVHLAQAKLTSDSFKDCPNLEEVYIETFDGIIPDELFMNCPNLTKFETTSVISKVGNRAFKGCKKLKNIKLLNCSKIGQEAFLNCESLTKISTSRKCQFGNDTFKGCTSIKDLSIPLYEDKLLDKIGIDPTNITDFDYSGGYFYEGIFKDCSKLKNVRFADCEEIGYEAFKNSGISRVDLSKVKYIDGHAFEDCTSLYGDINLANAQKVGFNAFANTDISYINIGSKLKVISQELFKDCKDIHKVTISEGVNLIQSRAFAGCNLDDVEITIPRSVLLVENHIFEDSETPTVFVYEEFMIHWSNVWDEGVKPWGLFNNKTRAKVKILKH